MLRVSGTTRRNAQKISTQYKRVKDKLDTYRSLLSQLDDMEVLLEMAAEESTGRACRPRSRANWSCLTRRSAGCSPLLEEQRLFNGEFDAGDAIVSIHPGAGGTESQDWAEMLLRMYLRWAQTRGFEVELNEATEGDEAGLKSVTFTVHGENAYGLALVRNEACTGWSGSRRSIRPAAVTPPSPRWM